MSVDRQCPIFDGMSYPFKDRLIIELCFDFQDFADDLIEAILAYEDSKSGNPGGAQASNLIDTPY